MKNKFLSRKFLIAVAAFLASVGTSITGLSIENETITIIGAVCTILSTGIYAFAEAYVDGRRCFAEMEQPYEQVNAIGFEVNNENTSTD